MTSHKVVVVTGANRGIGLAICEKILQNFSPVKLYACSRSGNDLDLKSSSSQITYARLDITQRSQIESLASSIKSDDGGVDVLINNAGFNNLETGDPKTLSQIMRTNYFGTRDMCLTFLPLMDKRQGARIVNVSSTGSTQRLYRQDVEKKVRDPGLSVDQVDSLAEDYLKVAESGQLGDKGKGTAYPVSKACVNALTTALAKDNPNVAVNCCCPGWVDTEMGSIVGTAPKSPADGAKIPVRLGFGDVEGVSGKYWSNPGVSDTGDGRVMAW